MANPGEPYSVNPRSTSETATRPPAAGVAGLPPSPPSVPGDAVTPPPPLGFSDSPTLAPAGPAPAAGATVAVPGYDILRELGRGGMGVVYQARQVRLNRPCALKMILAGAHASPEAAARLLAEAKAVAKLQHPNIVQIFHLDEYGGHPHFEMEFVGGGSLADRLDGTP